MIRNPYVGDYVFALDGCDTEGPTARIVAEIIRDGCICRTLGGTLGLLFKNRDLIAEPLQKTRVSIHTDFVVFED